MTLLALDMATSACSVALIHDGRLWRDHRVVPRGHNALALGMIDALCDRAGIARKQLHAVAYGRGPGSFTGLRIAAGIAQGIALALALPVIPVSTLEVLAAAALQRLPSVTRAIATITARPGELYVAGYRTLEMHDADSADADSADGDSADGDSADADSAEGTSTAWLDQPRAQLWHVLPWRVETCEPVGALSRPDQDEMSGGWTLCGDGADVWLNGFDGPPPAMLLTELKPDAAVLAQLALPRLRSGDLIDAADAVPVYLQHELPWRKLGE